MDELRKKAEAIIDQMKIEKLEYGDKDKLEIIYELLVHQRELEIQNEEIKRINLELEELKNRYFELYNSAPVGYLELNENGIIINHNNTLIKMLNLPDSSIVNRPFFDFIDKKDYRYFLSIYKDFYKEVEKRTIELRLKSKNAPKHTILTGRKDTKTDHILLTVTDITVLKDALEKMMTYLNIIELAPVSIIITDKNNKILYVNENYTKLTGYSKEELIGKDPGILKSGKLPRDFYKSLWESLKANKLWEGKFYNRKKNGEIFIEEAKILPITDEMGNIKNYIAVTVDVTEKEELERKQNLLRLNQSLANISGGIAHHLNNLNTPIALIAEEIVKNAKTDSEKRMGEILYNCVSKSSNIINSILKYSKKMLLNRKKVRFEMIINLCIEKCQKFTNKGYNIITDIKTPNIEIEADAEMLAQGLYNIIENAVEAMPAGGDILITVDEKIIEKDNKVRRYLVVSIKDNGIGIPEHIKTRIFEPFYTTKFIRNAVGLGLSESIGIVEQHDGFIDFQSEINKGTKFNIYIPTITSENQR